MDYRFYIGIDISKDTLDISCIDNQVADMIKHIQVTNNADGLKEMFNWLKKENNYTLELSIFCMEHTGLYNQHLLSSLVQLQASVWVENPVQIKRSGGLQRGKNDRIDAQRIAMYALRNISQVQLWQPSREVVDKIRNLSTLRDRLIETKKRLTTPIEEFKQFGNKQMARILEKSIAKSLKAIDTDIEKIEHQIKETINHDDQLRKLFMLITSVVGVGFVTAVNLIIYTNEFKLFSNARQLACYCGVAPFEHTSGTSIKGRTRVSHMANKKLKTNLHMGALTAVKLDPDLKTYYQRKVAEGKSKMSVLNAVRNKMLARIVAVVKREMPYQKIYFQNNLVLS